MLLDINEIIKILYINRIYINGVFHIGAHECEELSMYEKLGIKNENIIWIDAMISKVNEAKNRGIQNIYNAVINAYATTQIHSAT
jgi:hypothetical protein